MSGRRKKPLKKSEEIIQESIMEVPVEDVVYEHEGDGEHVHMEEHVMNSEVEANEVVHDLGDHMMHAEHMEGEGMMEEGEGEVHMEMPNTLAPVGAEKKRKTKRGPSGYTLFVAENRKRITEENPELKFGEISSKLAQIWKTVSREDKQIYNERAGSNAIVRGPEEEGEEVEPEGPKKRGRKRKERKWTKQEGAPKKAMTPYIAFGKTVRPEIKATLEANDPNTKPTDIMREVSARWMKLTAEERIPFEEMAAKDKIRYEAEKKTWLETRPPPEPKKPKQNIQHQQNYENNPQVKIHIKVRAQGEEYFDRVPLNFPTTYAKIIKAIQDKLGDHRPIVALVLLPNLRIRDDDDIGSLEENAEIEFVWGMEAHNEEMSSAPPKKKHKSE